MKRKKQQQQHELKIRTWNEMKTKRNEQPPKTKWNRKNASEPKIKKCCLNVFQNRSMTMPWPWDSSYHDFHGSHFCKCWFRRRPYERFYFVSSQKPCTGQNFSNFSRNFFEFFALAEIFSTAQNFFQNLADSAAIRLVQKSSKSEPSSPFFGPLKFRESLSRVSSFKSAALRCSAQACQSNMF